LPKKSTPFTGEGLIAFVGSDIKDDFVGDYGYFEEFFGVFEFNQVTYLISNLVCLVMIKYNF